MCFAIQCDVAYLCCVAVPFDQDLGFVVISWGSTLFPLKLGRYYDVNITYKNVFLKSDIKGGRHLPYLEKEINSLGIVTLVRTRKKKDY